MQARKTEEEEMRQQQRIKTMTGVVRKIKAEDRMDANNSWCVGELLSAACKKKNVGPSRMGGYNAAMV